MSATLPHGHMPRLAAFLVLCTWLSACDSDPVDSLGGGPPDSTVVVVADPIGDLAIYREDSERVDLSSRFATSDSSLISRYSVQVEGDAVVATINLTSVVIRATQLGSATVVVSAWGANDSEARDTVQVSVLDPCPEPSEFFPVQLGDRWTFNREEFRQSGQGGPIEWKRKAGESVWTVEDIQCQTGTATLRILTDFTGETSTGPSSQGPWEPTGPIRDVSTLYMYVTSNTLRFNHTANSEIPIVYPASEPDTVRTVQFTVSGRQRNHQTLVRGIGIVELRSSLYDPAGRSNRSESFERIDP